MSSDLGRGAHALLRIAAGLLFLQHGLQKLFGFFGGIQGTTVPLMSQLGVAGMLEVGGGLFLIAGLFTRPVAFLLAGEMAVAYFMGHAPQGFWPVLNQGTPAVLFCFVWLYISAAGPGPWSLDNQRRRGQADAQHVGSMAAVRTDR